MEKRNFISVGGRAPVNLSLVTDFFDMDYNDGTFGIKFYFTLKESASWGYKTKKERDKAYNFILKKHCICYSSESILKRKIKKAKKALYKKFISVVEIRKKPYNKRLSNAYIPLLSYESHNNIKNAEFKVVKNPFPAKKENRTSILKGVVNYFGG